MSSEPPELFDKSELWTQTLVRKLLDQGLTTLAEKIKDCGQKDVAFQCRNCGKVRWSPTRCSIRWCPKCGPRIAKARAEEIRIWISGLRQPKHVVLTQRNSETLTYDMVSRFSKNLTNLRRRKLSRNWKAGSWTLEITNESRGWHLHSHMLVESRWIDAGELSKEWGQLIGQDYGIVKVKDARPKDYAAEVAKYVVKPSQFVTWSPEEIKTLVESFRNVRVFGVFGELYRKRNVFRKIVAQHRKCSVQCECGASDWKFIDPLKAEFPELFRD
jgi:hypothetical protein